MIKRAPRDEKFTVLPNRTLEDDRLSWEAIGLLSYLLSKPDDWTVRKAHLVASRDAGSYKIKRILGELEDAGYLQRERIQKEDGTFDWVSVVHDLPQGKPLQGEKESSEDASQATIPQSSTDGSSTDGSSIDGKPPDITKTDSNKDGSNKEGERARAKAGEASSGADPQRDQREQGIRLLRQIQNGEWEGQIRPQEDWQAKMYSCAHPDYRPQSLTKLEWRETIDDPAAWAKAILVGIKRGWQPHTVDAREDRYERIVSGPGTGASSGRDKARVSIEEFGSHR